MQDCGRLKANQPTRQKRCGQNRAVDFKVVITQVAVNDVEEIVDYISRSDPRAAQRVADDLVSRAESLAEMPGRGKGMRRRPSVRRLVRNPCHIDEVAKVVLMLRFGHGAKIQDRFDWTDPASG